MKRNATAVLLSSQGAFSALSAVRTKGRIHELPFGIDTDRFRPVNTADVNSKQILFLGNVERRKGLDLLIRAFALLPTELGATLVVGGDGAALPDMRALALALGLERRVTFLGRVLREDVPALVAHAGVLCVPSRGEPFGLTILEAMASGRPIVATAWGGPRFILDAEGARLVPPEDPGAMSTALAEILSNSALMSAMGQHNRERAERNYSWDIVISSLERVYAVALEK